MHENKSSADFSSQLKYHHIKTYSLQRGDEYLFQYQAYLEEYNRLGRIIKRAEQTNREIQSGDFKRLGELKMQVGKTQLLIDSEGVFHSSAQLTHTFSATDVIAQKIDAILLTPAKNVQNWMCTPVFRDAIVYYDESGSVIACLNICFSCDRMMLNEVTYIDADASVYMMLKDVFVSFGHNIEK